MKGRMTRSEKKRRRDVNRVLNYVGDRAMIYQDGTFEGDRVDTRITAAISGAYVRFNSHMSLPVLTWSEWCRLWRAGRIELRRSRRW